MSAHRRPGFDYALLVTVGRAPLAGVGIVFMLASQPVSALACFVLFAAIDLADGHIARLRGEETGVRRVSDVLIDRVAIHLVILILASSLSYGYVLFATFVLRDLIQGVYSGAFTIRYRTVLVGPRWHMSYGLIMLSWVAFVLLDSDWSRVLTVAAWTISTAAFVDFIVRSRRIVRRSGD
jgi:phosphatidylglycerophosphate synthase